MGKSIDLSGKKFNRLTVIKCVGRNNSGGKLWLCTCDCGKSIIDTTSHITSNHTKSCGCFKREFAKKQFTKHGKKRTRLYNIWCDIKQRCFDENCPNYKNYGERGITVCDEWVNNFISFYDWSMENGYNKTLTIERINNDGNYEPNNCKWIAKNEQANNRRSTRYITYKGVTKNIKQWSIITGISYGCLLSRIHRGWNVNDALEQPVKNRS